MKSLRFFIEKSGHYLGVFLAFVLMMLSVLIVYDALARYLFSAGSIALQELEWHLFDLIILLSIGVTLRFKRHVRVDIFYQRFSAKHKDLVDLLTMVFMVIPFSLLVIYVGASFVEMSFAQMEGSANPGGLPYRYIIKSMIIVGFLFLIVEAVAHILNYIEMRKS